MENNKRQRTASSSAAENTTIIHISHLPVGLLVDVSSYLSKPSKAIFAVAMSAPSSSWNVSFQRQSSIISKAIISSTEWDTLDFEDVYNDEDNFLPIKLKDIHIGAILACIINAQHTLKILKLTGCTWIRGNGLEPLHGYKYIELIDLSLVGQNNEQEIIPSPYISEVCVLPILDSIISTNECSLKYIQFPDKWIANTLTNRFYNFKIKFNEKALRGISCSRCTEVFHPDYECLDIDASITSANLENHSTCYSCAKHFCHDCFNNDGSTFLGYCGFCKRNYCSDCDEITICGICGVGGRCSGCEDRSCCWECSYSRCALCLCKCERCEMSKCRDCALDIECDICERVICEDCSDGSTYSLKHCDDCCSTLCSHCQVGDCKIEGKGAC